MPTERPDLWSSTHLAAWQLALDRYVQVVAAQGVTRLPALDTWYRKTLPALSASRTPTHLLHADLVALTEWKMARGVWRAPNLVLVRGNAPADVIAVSGDAFAKAPHATQPIAGLATLAGVGPATASAALAAVAPAVYPFFDEIVAAQIPALGKVAWTLGYYARYATALRARAAALSADWTPVHVERALWAHAGGKAGVRG